MASTESGGVSVAARTAFFEQLAKSCNVAKSCAAAKISSGSVYRLRLTSKTFRDGWQRALAEGYVRLEAEAMAYALKATAPNISEKTLKQLALKHRMIMYLLSAHRAAVRGSRAASAPQPSQLPTADAAIGVLEQRFATMRERMIDHEPAGTA